MASGALPPAFPAVLHQWRTLLGRRHFFEHARSRWSSTSDRVRNSLIFSVNMWQPRGSEPKTIWQVLAPPEGHSIRQPRQKPRRQAGADPSFAQCHPGADQAYPQRRERDDPAVKELADYGCSTCHAPRAVPVAGNSTAKTTPRTSTSAGRGSGPAGKPALPTASTSSRNNPGGGHVDALQGVLIHESAE